MKKPYTFLFEKEMSFPESSGTKKVVTAIALKKGAIFFAKKLPANIHAFAKTEMAEDGCIMITALMDILLTIIGLNRDDTLKCNRIVFVRKDRFWEGAKGLGFAEENKCQASYNGQTNGIDNLYTYGGAQCMLFYKDERAIASGPFDPFGYIVKKTNRPLKKTRHLDIRKPMQQFASAHT